MITCTRSLASWGGIFDLDASTKRLDELTSLCEDPALWDQPQRAQSLLKERTTLQDALSSYTRLTQQLQDEVELLQLSDAEGDEDNIATSEQTLRMLHTEIKRRATECLFSGEADGNDCFLEINAGAGGTESQDWAEMLLRMYLRWAERHGFKTEMIHYLSGEEAGVKSAALKIIGPNAYGWAKTESGVHRLVRISPFDSNARRHTSFASAWVYPVINETIQIVIEEKDLRVDTYRASGAGGQHVNKTDSAIRITHLPTNIVVQCQNNRSQHRNRAEAMDMLRSRLYEQELQKQEEAKNKANATKTDIGWGHQIRSYVLQPYQMVKDLRTGFQSPSPSDVLDGDLDDFIMASLSAKIIQKS